MDDGTWRLLAEKMQQEFEERNSLLGDLLRMGSLRTEGGVYIPTDLSDRPAATWADAEPSTFSLDDLNELVDMLGPKREQPYSHIVISRREMQCLDEAIAKIQPYDSPLPDRLFGMSVVVSDTVPEGNVLILKQPLFEFGWDVALEMDDVTWNEVVFDDYEVPHLQLWQLCIILFAVMAVIVLLLGG